LPPLSLETCFSKVKVSPVGSAAAGCGCPSTSHRSLKCDCAPCRSESSLAFQRSMNSGSARDVRGMGSYANLTEQAALCEDKDGNASFPIPEFFASPSFFSLPVERSSAKPYHFLACRRFTRRSEATCRIRRFAASIALKHCVPIASWPECSGSKFALLPSPFSTDVKQKTPILGK
jgi:hypothetical protein